MTLATSCWTEWSIYQLRILKELCSHQLEEPKNGIRNGVWPEKQNNASLLDEHKIPACYCLVILHQQSKSNVIITSLSNKK